MKKTLPVVDTASARDPRRPAARCDQGIWFAAGYRNRRLPPILLIEIPGPGFGFVGEPRVIRVVDVVQIDGAAPIGIRDQTGH
jgi:hypothetical protein